MQLLTRDTAWNHVTEAVKLFGDFLVVVWWWSAPTRGRSHALSQFGPSIRAPFELDDGLVV